MRLFFYWIVWGSLFYLLTLQDKTNPLYMPFVFILTMFFAMLVVYSLRSIARAWRPLLEKLRYTKKEREIKKRDATTPSPLEERLAKALDDANIPYEREYQISKMHVDFAFPKSKLVVECDGFRYHASSEARSKDRKRDDELHRRGWTVLRFTGGQIRNDIEDCIRKIKERL